MAKSGAAAACGQRAGRLCERARLPRGGCGCGVLVQERAGAAGGLRLGARRSSARARTQQRCARAQQQRSSGECAQARVLLQTARIITNLVIPVRLTRMFSNMGATTSYVGLPSCAAVMGISISSRHGSSSSFSSTGKLN